MFDHFRGTVGLGWKVFDVLLTMTRYNGIAGVREALLVFFRGQLGFTVCRASRATTQLAPPNVFTVSVQRAHAFRYIKANVCIP